MSRSLYIFHVLFFFTATEAALTHQYSSQHPTLGIRPQLIDKTEQQGPLFKNVVRRDTGDEVPEYIKMTELKDHEHNQALIHWTGYAADDPSSSIFILTRKKSNQEIVASSFWRSDDYGRSFTNENKKFHSSNLKNEDNTLHSFVISPLNKRKVIFLESIHAREDGINLFIWVSNDEGNTFKSYQLPEGVILEELKFHPKKEDWLVGLDRIHRKLYFSNNSGENWQLVHDKVTPERYFWYEPEVDLNSNLEPGSDGFGEISADRLIHMEVESSERSPLGNQAKFEMKTCLVPNCASPGSYYEELNAATRSHSVSENSLMIRDNFIFFEKANGAIHSLYVSHRRKPFKAAVFPEDMVQRDFHIVTSDQGFVMLSVNVEHVTDSYISQLFSSSEDGSVYRLVLSNLRYFNKRQNNLSSNTIYTSDVHEVKGLKGCFLANQHRRTLLTSTDPQDNQQYVSESNRTLISWNSGKTWQPLTLEEKDNEGNWVKKKFEEGYGLNLHLEKSQTDIGYYAPNTFSKDSSPGFIIAHGAVWKTLEERPKELKLYISQNGGKTWRNPDGKDGRFVSTFLDQGAITIAVKMLPYVPTKHFHVSTTQGHEWTDISFSSKAINVDAVLTEPGEATQVVTIFGHDTWTKPWQIFTVNLTEIAEACSQNDYEDWTYTKCDAEANQRIGMKVQIKRRKPLNSCLNREKIENVVFNETCESCSLDDYFCQEGFIPTEDYRCRNTQQSSAADSDYLIKKTNLRPIKSPGNTCQKEYDWARSEKLPFERFRLGIDDEYQKNRFIFPIFTNLKLKVENAAGDLRWSLKNQQSGKIDKTAQTTGSSTSFMLDKVGSYKINVTDDKEYDFLDIQVFKKISSAKLYCPPYVHPGVKNQLIVKASADGEWLDNQIEDFGQLQYNWYGDIGDLAQPVSFDPIANITFPVSGSNSPRMSVAMNVKSPIEQVVTKCVLINQPDAQIIKVLFEKDSRFVPSNDDEMFDNQKHWKRIILGVSEISEYLKEADLEPDFYTPPSELSALYIYLFDEFKDIKIVKMHAEKIGEMIMKEIESGTLPFPSVNSVSYLKSDGSFSDFQEGSAGGRVFGLIILVLITSGLLYVGGRWLYKWHQAKRYRGLPLDQEAIIDQDELGHHSSGAGELE